MPIDVVMPQMGESIAEGTIVRWIKRVGDRVERDEPLCEISTDKVDAEVPSPAAGVLREIRVAAGDTVPVHTVMAVIGQPGEPSVAPSAAPPPDRGLPAPVTTAPPPPLSPQTAPAPSEMDVRRRRSSPVVRRVAREHGVNLARVSGTGVGGRVTRDDLVAYIDRHQGDAASSQDLVTVTAGDTPVFQPGQQTVVVPMSVMRRTIAERMVLSRRTSAHVHSIVDVDFTGIAKIRAAKQDEYARAGVKLTYLAFIARATVSALQAVPVVNASIEGETVVYRRHVNLGIAVALAHGLIVPVIKRAEESNLLGLSRAIEDLAARARSKRLSPDDVQEGTFTITNPGVFGTLLGLPIINQPQVAILAVGAIEKRPVVVDDAIAIRHRCYLALGYDHRLIDGAVADTFLSHIKRELETFDSTAA